MSAARAPRTPRHHVRMRCDVTRSNGPPDQAPMTLNSNLEHGVVDPCAGLWIAGLPGRRFRAFRREPDLARKVLRRSPTNCRNASAAVRVTGSSITSSGYERNEASPLPISTPSSSIVRVPPLQKWRSWSSSQKRLPSTHSRAGIESTRSGGTKWSRFTSTFPDQADRHLGTGSSFGKAFGMSPGLRRGSGNPGSSRDYR